VNQRKETEKGREIGRRREQTRKVGLTENRSLSDLSLIGNSFIKGLGERNLKSEKEKAPASNHATAKKGDWEARSPSKKGEEGTTSGERANNKRKYIDNQHRCQKGRAEVHKIKIGRQQDAH